MLASFNRRWIVRLEIPPWTSTPILADNSPNGCRLSSNALRTINRSAHIDVFRGFPRGVDLNLTWWVVAFWWMDRTVDFGIPVNTEIMSHVSPASPRLHK